jgi:dihydrofolate reductase
MASLIYSAIASLDGYIEDEQGKFDWAAPDEEVHAFVNDLERPVGTSLYGRRMYETMVYWESEAASAEEQSAVARDFAAIWRKAEKVVFSRSLENASSERTRIERSFEPDAIRAIKGSAERDLAIGGSELAAQAIAAELVDELHLFLAPVIVGAGKRALPEDGRLDLELLGERRFESGFVHLHYRLSV